MDPSFLSASEIRSLHARITTLHQALAKLEQEERDEHVEAFQRAAAREQRRQKLLHHKTRLAAYVRADDNFREDPPFHNATPRTTTPKAYSQQATGVQTLECQDGIFKTHDKVRRHQHIAHLKDWRQRLMQLGLNEDLSTESIPHQLLRKRRDAALDSFDRLAQKIGHSCAQPLKSHVGGFQLLGNRIIPAPQDQASGAVLVERDHTSVALQEILLRRELRAQKEKARLAEIASHKEKLLQLQRDAKQLEMEVLNYDPTDSQSAMSDNVQQEDLVELARPGVPLTMHNLHENTHLMDGPDNQAQRVLQRENTHLSLASRQSKRNKKLSRLTSNRGSTATDLKRKISRLGYKRHSKERHHFKYDDVSFSLSDASDGTIDTRISKYISDTDDDNSTNVSKRTYHGPRFYDSHQRHQPLSYGHTAANAFLGTATAGYLHQQQAAMYQQQAAAAAGQGAVSNPYGYAAYTAAQQHFLQQQLSRHRQPLSFYNSQPTTPNTSNLDTSNIYNNNTDCTAEHKPKKMPGDSTTAEVRSVRFDAPTNAVDIEDGAIPTTTLTTEEGPGDHNSADNGSSSAVVLTTAASEEQPDTEQQPQVQVASANDTVAEDNGELSPHNSMEATSVGGKHNANTRSPSRKSLGTTTTTTTSSSSSSSSSSSGGSSGSETDSGSSSDNSSDSTSS